MLVALVAAAVCGAASASLPPLVGVAVASLDGGGDQALVHLDPSTGAHIVTHKLAAEVGDIVPACFALVPPAGAAVVCTLRIDGTECVNFLDASTGALTRDFCSKTLVIDNLAYDNMTQQLFFNGFDTTKQANFVYEVHYSGNSNLTVTEVAAVPGTVQVAICAYSSAKHLLFMTLETVQNPNSLNAVVAVSTLEKKVVAKAEVLEGILILMYDDKTSTLYGWNANSTTAGILATIDPNNGKTEDVLGYSQLSGNGGSAVIGPDGNVYSMLLDFSNDDNAPVWVVSQISPPKSTTTPVPDTAVYPYVLGMAFAS